MQGGFAFKGGSLHDGFGGFDGFGGSGEHLALVCLSYKMQFEEAAVTVIVFDCFFCFSSSSSSSSGTRPIATTKLHVQKLKLN